MSAEPERPIEKWLRAFSRRRRDTGAGFELHPATRRLLQGEVARRYGLRAAKSGRPLLWGRLLPRLAWTGALAAVCVAAWVVWLRPQPTIEMARHESAPAGESALPSAGPPVRRLGEAATRLQSAVDQAKGGAALSDPAAPVAPSAAVPRDSLVAEATPADAVLKAKAAGTPLAAPPASAAAPGPAAATAGRAANEPEPLAESVAASSVRVPLSAPDESASPVGDTSQLAARSGDNALWLNQSFRHAESHNAALAPAPANAARPVILADFQVEQDGSDIRVIDQDGSVYSGTIQPPPMEASRRLQTQPPLRGTARDVRPTVDASEPNATPEDRYQFTVTGTNRSLNQRVVFSGDLIPATNALAFGAQTNLPASQQVFRSARYRYSRASPGPAQTPLLFQNINGRATIDGRTEVLINAMPADPVKASAASKGKS